MQVKSSSNYPVKALLFDLGGVVIDIDFSRMFSRWAMYSGRSIDEIRSRFSMDPVYQAHEKGEISITEYFSSLRDTLAIDISDIQFEEGWNSIFKAEISGMSELLQNVKGKLPLYAFTNSNRAHEKVWSRQFSQILAHFETVLISSDIGLRKPEAEAFHFVADAIGTDPGQIAFYDDSIENIAGARDVGLDAVHVRSLSDVRDSLTKILG